MKKILLILFYSISFFVGTGLVFYGINTDREMLYYAAIGFLAYCAFSSLLSLKGRSKEKPRDGFHRLIQRSNVIAYLFVAILSTVYCLIMGEYLLAVYPLVLLPIGVVLHKAITVSSA